MYAIIQSGSKQYRVEEGDIIHVELLGDITGGAYVFKEVLFVQDEKTRVGAPFVSDCFVQGEVLGEAKGPKVICFKMKRRKNCRTKIGHRQTYARVRITAIGAADKKPVAPAKKEKASPAPAKAAAPKAEPVKKAVKAPSLNKAEAPKKIPAKKAEKPAVKAAEKKPAAKKKTTNKKEEA